MKTMPAKATRTVRLLLSYFYYREEDLAKLLAESFGDIAVDVFADSGAFSAFTQGKPVAEDDYIAWVKKWQHLFTVVAGPDVIGNAEETKQATLRMRQQVQGVSVLPTFHVGEDWSYLDFWVQQPDVDYIALGGMVPYTRRLKLLAAWVKKAFSKIPNTIRVHGFGLTTWSLLKQFPWYSVDSSSWTSGFRYAQLMLFDSRRGRFVSVSMNDRVDLLKNAALLETYGIRASQAKADDYDRDLLVAVSVEAWQRAEEWLNKGIYFSVGTGAHASSAPTSGSARGQATSLKTYLVTGPAPNTPNHPAIMGPAIQQRQK